MPLYNVYRAKRHAKATLAPAGANNDIVVWARDPSTGGNALTVTLAVAGNNTPLGVTRSSNDITVAVATSGGGAATSTAAQVIAALNTDPDSAPFVFAENATGNDGTGVVAAVGSTPLAGGKDDHGDLVLIQEGVSGINDEDACSSVAPEFGSYLAIPQEMARNHWVATPSSDTYPFSRTELDEED